MSKKKDAPPKETVQISVRLPVKLLEEIEGLAATQHRTRNNMIEMILWQGLPRPEDMHDLGM
jgi:metal-responsive CopG/Arc/MetJ family transcriptional regulator